MSVLSLEKRLEECPLKLGLTINDYNLEEVLSYGDFGAVFLGVNKQTGKRSAFKCIWKDWGRSNLRLQRFMHEIFVMKEHFHSALMEFYASGSVDTIPFFYMEYIPGITLAEKIERRGALSLREVLEIADQLCTVLYAVHKRSIVHRDITPRNVYVTNTEELKLLDFGVAYSPNLDASVHEYENKNRGRKFVGTPGYVSPEHLKGELVDGRSDLYSVGAVMLYCLSGGKLWEDLSTQELLLAHINDALPDFEELGLVLPELVEEIIRKVMAKDPDLRYQSAWFMQQGIKRAHQEHFS